MFHGHHPISGHSLADSGQRIRLDVVKPQQMDGKQFDHLAVASLQQAYRQLHQSVGPRAPLVLDISNSHGFVAHQSDHPVPQMRQKSCISSMLNWNHLEVLTTVTELSVPLAGLPNPNWTHLCRESIPFPGRHEGKPCRTAGDDHQATSDRTH